MRPVAPLTTRELDALECARRSGISPTDATVDRLIAYARSLEQAVRWSGWRIEDALARLGPTASAAETLTVPPVEIRGGRAAEPGQVLAEVTSRVPGDPAAVGRGRA